MKPLNLAISLLFVKVFLCLPGASANELALSDLILAKGEQKELHLKGVKKFSVGNPDVISYKFFPKSNILLLKGKRVGFTDLIIWQNGQKSSYSIYILSKQKFLKTFQLADTLKNLNLTIDIRGPIMTASGEISEFSDYLYLNKVKRQYKDQVYLKVNLGIKLRNFIIGNIYHKLYQNGFSSVICQNHWIEMNCFYEGQENTHLIKQMAQTYEVNFIPQDSKLKQKNFQLKLKLVQLERADGLEINMGMDKLHASVKDLFAFGVSKLVEDNMIFLQRAQMDLSTLAEPEMVVNLNNSQLIEIGSEIQYQNISSQGNNLIAPIDWKFAGLKIKTKLTESYGKILLEYETEFSRPTEKSISGSKEISTALLRIGEPIKIFQIGFQTTSKDHKGIPGLSSIPILKHLFESKSDQKTYKHIYGYVLLEEVP